MNPGSDALVAPGRSPALAAGTAPEPDGLRLVRLGLAAVWLLDGVLQLQASMFADSFATGMLAPTAKGNPAWVAGPIEWAAGIVAAHPVWLNALFALVQLALGAGIAWRRTLRPALAASIAWALLVWWFGEGLGGLLLPGASALGGAPGAALLYAVLALVLWPVGDRAAKAVWVLLWGGLAALELEPGNLDPGGVHALLDGKAQGQPGWLDALVSAFGSASDEHGTALALAGALVLGLVAAGILLPAPFARAAVVLAVAVSAFVWVFGEALGSPVGGQATDPNSGPLLALIAVAYWPRTRTGSPPETPDAETSTAAGQTGA